MMKKLILFIIILTILSIISCGEEKQDHILGPGEDENSQDIFYTEQYLNGFYIPDYVHVTRLLNWYKKHGYPDEINMYYSLLTQLTAEPETPENFKLFKESVNLLTIGKLLETLAEINYKIAILNYNTGDFNNAKVYFFEITRKYPSTTFADDAYYYLMHINAILGHYDESSMTAKKLILYYPDSSYADEAKFERGRNYYARKKYSDSRQEFREYLKNYPAALTEDRAHAQFFIGQTYFIERNYRRAYAEWQKVIDDYPEEDYAVDAAEKIKWLQIHHLI